MEMKSAPIVYFCLWTVHGQLQKPPSVHSHPRNTVDRRTVTSPPAVSNVTLERRI